MKPSEQRVSINHIEQFSPYRSIILGAFDLSQAIVDALRGKRRSPELHLLGVHDVFALLATCSTL